ncbi:xylulokinase [Malassezia sp. CBS 17886]|nr:xylulokinase [Malassezia sp. CBS 17886]
MTGADRAPGGAVHTDRTPPRDPLFVGLDLSTQALKASLLDVQLQGVDEVHVRFDGDLRDYGTCGGILPRGHPLLVHERGADVAAAPVAMYVAAMDLLWDRITQERHWPVDRIVAISAAGQQHASVCFSQAAAGALARAHGGAMLTAQLVPHAFSRAIVPNWQDASTLAECADLSQCAEEAWSARPCGAARPADGGRALARGTDPPRTAPLCQVTGSIAHTRFTGAQILRWRRTHPDEYERTAHIALVSNFVATLLCAGGGAAAQAASLAPHTTHAAETDASACPPARSHVAPIDRSDACGMNLWDMDAQVLHWSAPLTDLVGGGRDAGGGGGGSDLRAKLQPVAMDPTAPVGYAGAWLRDRYGVRADCLVCQATGDNPATLQCLTPRFRDAVVSLGTSDTILLPSDVYAPADPYHVFAHPAALPTACDAHEAAASATPPYFLMFVYKNGSLAREWARDTYCSGRWDVFDDAVASARAPGGGIGFYWLRPEIIPWNARGVHRFERDAAGFWQPCARDFHDARANARAMVESQFLAFRASIEKVLGRSGVHLRRVFVVGGAAENATLCQMLADVLGCEVARPHVGTGTEGGDSGAGAGGAGEAGAGAGGHPPGGAARSSGEPLRPRPAAYNFCSVGAAYRARWVWECEKRREQAGMRHQEHGGAAGAATDTASMPSFEDVVADARGGTGATYTVVATPAPAAAAAYDALVAQWAALEARAVSQGEQGLGQGGTEAPHAETAHVEVDAAENAERTA